MGTVFIPHLRGQTSIALSSMEPEVLAATGLLAEGVALKQALQPGSVAKRIQVTMLELR